MIIRFCLPKSKILIASNTSCLLQNNLCEFTTNTHKFKTLLVVKKNVVQMLVLKISDIQKIRLGFGVANSINTHLSLNISIHATQTPSNQNYLI